MVYLLDRQIPASIVGGSALHETLFVTDMNLHWQDCKWGEGSPSRQFRQVRYLVAHYKSFTEQTKMLKDVYFGAEEAFRPTRGN